MFIAFIYAIQNLFFRLCFAREAKHDLIKSTGDTYRRLSILINRSYWVTVFDATR